MCAAVAHQYVGQPAESQPISQMANSITSLLPIQLQKQIDHSAQQTLAINNVCSFHFFSYRLPRLQV